MALTAAALNIQLKSEIKRVYLFFGEEKYLHNLYAERVKDKVLQGPFAQFNYSVFEDGTSSFEDFSAQINTYPQMSEKKLILLKNTDFLTSTAYQKPMEAILKNLPEYIVLVFSEPDSKKIKKNLLKLIETHGSVVEFAKQSTSDLRSWVCRRLGKSGKRITNENAQLLIDMCERDLLRLETECDKLISASGDIEAISTELINDMVYMSLEFSIFAMADMLLSGNAKGAYKTLNKYKIAKEQPTFIISLIYSQLSMLYMFKQLKQNAVEYLPPNRKFLANKLSTQSRKHDEDKLRSAMRQCAQYEDKIKNGQIESWTALELIMAFLLT
ncbi:MAG: DNA polymerase III subunit delta [Clostridiaceae bacterium]|nr:DNA polymerase III subunit delta [Clostridiaceae bacterium]